MKKKWRFLHVRIITKKFYNRNLKIHSRLTDSLTISSLIINYLHCMKKKNFRLRKICEKGEKYHIFFSFYMFSFYENIIFFNFPSNENVRERYLSANAYSCVNMKFWYTIAGRKDENFYVVL